MDNLEEMDKFLEKYNLPKLNQEEIENLKRSKISIEIETVIKNLPTKKKAQDQVASHVIVPKIQRTADTYPTQTFPKNCRRK